MARRGKKELEDSEEVRAAIADLQEKVAAKKAAEAEKEEENEEKTDDTIEEITEENEETSEETSEEATEEITENDSEEDDVSEEEDEEYDEEYDEEDYAEEFPEEVDAVYEGEYEYSEEDYANDIAVKNFEDRINDTVPTGGIGDAIREREEQLAQERELEEAAALERKANREKKKKESGKTGRKKKRKGKNDDDVIISLEGVSKSYIKGVPALNDVNIQIKRGEFVFIVGDSGSGKSTLIRLLLRELKPTEGSIMVNGFQVEKLPRYKVPKLRRSMGVVFQDFRLLKDRNVYENVAFAQRIIQVPMREMKRNVPNILALVGLAGKYKARPNELSGGEQQRVALARALVNKPPILLADEPTGNLDVKNTIEIMNLLDRINKNGTTVVVVTHNDKIVNDMKKRVITIKKGVIVSDEEAGGYIYED